MASTTALRRVTLNGEFPPVLSNIIDFAGQDVRLIHVNKAFRKAVEYSANQVCRRFMAVSADADLHPDEGSPGRMQAKFLEIEQAHRDWAGAHFFWVFLLRGWPEEWERVRDLMQNITQLPDGPAKNLRSERLLRDLNRLSAEHEHAVAALPPPGGVAGLGLVPAIDQDPMQRPLETLKNIGFDESLQQRFQAAIGPREGRGALNPEERGLESLEALHAAQQEQVALSVAHRLRFERLPHLHSFAYEDLLQAERIAHAADSMEGNTLLEIGQMITGERFAGHAPATTLAQWRAWLNNPDNAVHLRNLRYFFIHGPSIFPRRIDQFAGLQRLRFDGTPENYLTAVPPEVGNLPQLRELRLDGHQIQEIPPFIGGLRHLETLSLNSNGIEELPAFLATLPQLRTLEISNNPIRVLPDELYRHLEPANSFLEGVFNPGRWLYINRQNLHQIPFRLWFRESSMITLSFKNWWCLLDVILALPVLLITFFLLEIVEPIVTFFRDQFNYSRMVPIDPQPQEDQV